MQGNWKFAQENHVDGYHLPFVHPDLNSYSPLRDHRPIVIEGSASGHISLGQHHAGAIGDSRLPYNPDLSEPYQQGRAEFLSIFPNIMIEGMQRCSAVASLLHLAAVRYRPEWISPLIASIVSWRTR